MKEDTTQGRRITHCEFKRSMKVSREDAREGWRESEQLVTARYVQEFTDGSLCFGHAW